MEKRGRILSIALALALLGLLAWTAVPAWTRPQLSYAGKPLRYWLTLLGPSPAGLSDLEAVSAIHHIGTNAIPALLELLRTRDIPLKRNVLVWAEKHHVPGAHYVEPWRLYERASIGFRAIGPAGSNAVPELAKILDQDPDQYSAHTTMWIISCIGPAAKDAAPSLLRLAKRNAQLRVEAIGALGCIDSYPEGTVPFLIQALKDHQLTIREPAVIVLGQCGTDAKAALPALVEILNEPAVKASPSFLRVGICGSPGLRNEVELAIQAIDPATFARVVTNPPSF